MNRFEKHRGRRRARFLLACTLAGFCALSSPVRADDGMTLLQAMQIGLETNPDFESAAGTQEAADARLDQARALYMPLVDLQVETGYESTDTPVIRKEELMRRRATLTLTQLLFDGFGTSSEIDRYKSASEEAALKTYESSELVGLAVANSFLNVLRRRELVRLAQANVDAHKKLYERIRDGNKHGKFNKGDVGGAEARLAQARANFESIKQSLEESEAAYRQVVGVPVPEKLAEPVFSADMLPQTVDEYVEVARRTSPTLAVLDKGVSAAQAGVQSAKSRYFPRVELQLSGSKGDDLNGIKGDESLASALVVMRWNLFNGGADSARVREALASRRVAESDRVSTARNLEKNIRDTWAARRASINQLVEFDRQVAANKKVVEAYKDQFSLGRRSLQDVLDSQSDLFLAESNFINTHYSRLFADYRLLALGGGLLETLKINKPKAVKTGMFAPFSIKVENLDEAAPPPAGDTKAPPCAEGECGDAG